MPQNPSFKSNNRQFSQERKISKVLKNTLIFVLCFYWTLLVGILHIAITSEANLKDVFCTNLSSNHCKNIEKKIIVDTSMLDEYGGITCLTENLIRQIAQTKPQWSFTLLLKKENRVLSGLTQLKNVKVIKVTDAFGYAKDLIFNLLNIPTFGLARDKLMQLVYYGNVFLNDNPDIFWEPVGGRTFNNFSVPKVTTIHDTLEVDQSEFFEKEWINQIKERNFKGLKNSYKIITVSEFTKKRIIDVYGIKSDKIRVIPIRLAKRVQLPLSKTETQSILDKYKLSSHNYFIFVSQYYPHKNHQRLIQAFADFIKNNRDYQTIKLVITGNMSDAHGIIEQFAEKQLCKGNIIFTGRIDTAELAVLLSNALCFIHPSWYEGFGMPIVEAMSCGIPVACSNVASLPEVAGDAAIYFNPYDTSDIARVMLRIVQSRELRKNLIKKGHERVKKFEDSQAMIDAYIKVFNETNRK